MSIEKKYHLLFLARPFPPIRASGAVRTGYLAKYLAKLGWKVTVVTVGVSDKDPILLKEFHQVQEKYKNMGVNINLAGRWPISWEIRGGISKYLNRIIYRLNPFDIHKEIGWAIRSLFLLMKMDLKNVDLVLATGKPYSSFLVAYMLKKIFGKPYVLDYRDPWTINPHKEAAKSWVVLLERKIVANSESVVTVSPSWARAIKEFVAINTNVEIISNGFDPEDMQDVVPKRFDRPALVYSGIFYPPKRIIAPVFHALKMAIKQLPRYLQPKLHYYGPHNKYVREEAEKAKLTNFVVYHGLVSRKEVFSALKGAKLAVVITSVFPEGDLLDRGIVTGKIFEAINTKTPIFLIAPHGSDARRILEDVNGGEAFVGSDIEGMADFIIRACRGEVKYDFSGASRYNWENLAQKLDDLLRSIYVNSEK